MQLVTTFTVGLPMLSDCVNKKPVILSAMKYVAFLIVLLPLFVAGQETTRGGSRLFVSQEQETVAIVPFEPRMIISDVHQEMCRQNQLGSKALHEQIAEGFFYALRKQAPRAISADVYGWSDEWPSSLDSIYGSMKYKALTVDTTEMAVDGSTRVIQGQLVSSGNSIDKYIAAQVDSTLIRRMAAQSSGSFVLVVSELDIRNLGVPVQIDPSGVKLFLQVHYSLFDKEGDLRKGGIVRLPFEKNSLDIVSFTKKDLFALANELYREIGLTPVEQ